MPLRLLTIADVPQIRAIMQAAYGAPVDAARLFDPPPAGGRAIVVGDPSVPALTKLLHYQMTAQQIALFPLGLRTLLTASSGWSTQVSDFYPLSASNPAITAALLPFLASVLRAIIAKAPVGIRATLAGRPVWAAFDAVSAADAGALVNQFKLAFPSAGSSGRMIWHGRLDNARDAVAASAVDV